MNVNGIESLQLDGPAIDETPRVAPLPALGAPAPAAGGDPVGFGNLVELFAQGGHALDKAASSEHAFAMGSGDLQSMILDRAQADIMLSAATTATSKVTQSLQTILNMQV